MPRPQPPDATFASFALPGVLLDWGGRQATGVSVIGTTMGFTWDGGTCPPDEVLILTGNQGVTGAGIVAITVAPLAWATTGVPVPVDGARLPRSGAALLFDYAEAIRVERPEGALAALAARHILQMMTSLLAGAQARDPFDSALALVTRDPRLTSDAIAAALGLSLRQLRTAASRRGHSLHAEITRLRLEHARARLRDPACALRIADLAFDAGFTDLGTFNRQFRRHYGTSPRGMRG